MAEPLLEPLDLHRHRRLRLVHPPRRLGETAAIGNGAKALQLVEIEGHGHRISPSLDLMIGMKSICWTNECPARISTTSAMRRSPNPVRQLPAGTTEIWRRSMALVLSGERPSAAARPFNPVPSRRHAGSPKPAPSTPSGWRCEAFSISIAHRLEDLGINRGDLFDAMHAPSSSPTRLLADAPLAHPPPAIDLQSAEFRVFRAHRPLRRCPDRTGLPAGRPVS